jgi:hypothetical protein
MPTVKEIIDDVVLQLTQSNPSDDIALEDRQLAAWLSYHANELVTIEINSKLAKSEPVPQLYVIREECVVADLEDTDCSDDCEDRISLTLQNEILTLNNNSGIVLVESDEGDQIRKSSLESRANNRLVRFSKPSEENPTYYGQGTKVYVEGFKEVNIPFDKFHVWYVPKRNYMTALDSAEVVVSDLVLPVLIDALVQRGKLELYGTQDDKVNDGVDSKDTVYHTAISNPQNNQ